MPMAVALVTPEYVVTTSASENGRMAVMAAAPATRVRANSAPPPSTRPSRLVTVSVASAANRIRRRPFVSMRTPPTKRRPAAATVTPRMSVLTSGCARMADCTPGRPGHVTGGFSPAAPAATAATRRVRTAPGLASRSRMKPGRRSVRRASTGQAYPACHHRPMQEIGAGGTLIRRDRLARQGEEERLSPSAARSVASHGRVRPEEPDPYRTAFERDRDRIIHSKAFRRLKHKTQVFLNPEGDHYVTRLTHTMQVTQVARALAAALSLNEPLAEAIALGHDVGHSPFGHTGEEALSPYFDPEEWHHAAQSVRIWEVLEDANLTWEVRDGIRAHSWKVAPPPATAEAFCVRFADRIAYLAHDALDALRAGVLSPDAFPPTVLERFGEPGREWISSMINAVIEESLRTGAVRMDNATLEVMNELRDLMDWHLEHPEEIPDTYRQDEAGPQTQAADYIAGMTDRFALATHDRLF